MLCHKAGGEVQCDREGQTFAHRTYVVSRDLGGNVIPSQFSACRLIESFLNEQSRVLDPVTALPEGWFKDLSGCQLRLTMGGHAATRHESVTPRTAGKAKQMQSE